MKQQIINWVKEKGSKGAIATNTILKYLEELPELFSIDDLEMHIISNEDDWFRNPRKEFEVFKKDSHE